MPHVKFAGGILTNEERARILALLSGDNKIRLTSHGCGSRTKFGYRLDYYDDHGGYRNCVVGRDGKFLSGTIADDQLRQLCQQVIMALTNLITKENS